MPPRFRATQPQRPPCAAHTLVRSLDEAIRDTTNTQPLITSDDVGDAARIAAEVYHADEKVPGKKSLKQTLEEIGTHVTEIPSKDGKGTRAMVIAEPEGKVTIAFRETKTGKDKKDDFNARPVPLDAAKPEIKVHPSFKQESDAIYTDVLTAIPKGAKRIMITGHSLGGADASIAAVKLRRDLGDTIPIGVITFGAPRVGNQKFAEEAAKATDGNYVRVVKEWDPMPALAIRDTMHTGKPIVLFDNGIGIGNKDGRGASAQG